MQALQPSDDQLAEEHAAAFLLMAALSLAAGSLIYLLTLRLAVPDQVARLAGPSVLILVSAFAIYCHRRRRVRAGLLALGIGIWLEITLMAVITGGMKAPAIYLYPLIILMAGWLLGLRLALGFAFMSVLACVVLTLAESAGLIAPVPNRSLLLLVIQAGALIFTTVIVSRIVGSYQARLEDVKRLGTELNERMSALAASEASFHGLFNTVYEAIYILDRDGRFLAVNDGAVRMYGYPREILVGRTPEFVSAPGRNDLAAVAAMMQRAFAGEPQRFEFWGRRADGEAFPKEVRLVRGTWFGQDVLIATADDITGQVQAREEIRHLNAGLEKRVQERTSELTAANRELESFAYSISHDLRSPLRAIDGFSHLLAEDYEGKLDEQGRDYLGRVRKAVQRMGTLIDDILELSRVTRQEMRREPVDLGRLAAELNEEIARAWPDRHPALSLTGHCLVEGDPQLLRLMLQNLLENAWKYSARHPAPEIEFGCETLDGRQVCYVRDNGVGFDMAHAGRLFTPFQRLHKPEEFQGNGIGLATVSRIVRRHGGRIWAESSPGAGATFRFTLG
ncbi:MAG: PAS domain S-box protein [Rhodocyclaceae bacterium]|nr:PAS domain S-box protein [Rhodocyclaceae bacterium]